MSNTPETDEQTFTWATAEVNLPPPDLKLVRAGFAQQMERERNEARERLKWDGIHTCHDNCQRPACVARRERDEARKIAESWRATACSCPGVYSEGPFPWETETMEELK